jgi:hypothetical protein
MTSLAEALLWPQDRRRKERYPARDRFLPDRHLARDDHMAKS